MRRLAIIIVQMCLFVGAFAQNNKYHIDDRLYAMFEEADKWGGDSIVGVYADSIIGYAKEIGDKKGECVGWMLKMRRGSVCGQQQFRVATDSLIELSRRVNSKQYYYYACVERATYLLEHDNIIEAVNYISQIREDSYRDNNVFGIYSCHRLQGDLNNKRGNYISSYNEYLNALRVVKRIAPAIDPSMAYQRVGKALYFLGRYEEGIVYLDSCLMYKDLMLSSCYNAYQFKCLSYFYMHRFDDYKSCYEIMMDYKKSLRSDLVTYGGANFWEMLNLYIEGNSEEAKRLANRWGNQMAKYDLLMTFYEFDGDYGKAYLYCDSLNKSTLEAYGSTNGSDIIALNVAINKSELEHKAKDLQLMRDSLALLNMKLEQNKEKLELENTMLELGRTNAEVEAQNLLLFNYNLEMTNNSMSINQRNIEMDRKKAALEDEQNDHKHRLVITSILIVAFLLLVLAVIFFIVQRNKAIKDLQYSNNELENARILADEMREKAERSEQMKTLFLQNMSHDIRTPLNAICGFSQLIIDPEVSEGMDDDQMRQFSELIVNNTDMLTTLVNDILNVSELESGKYKMNKRKVRVNDLCRMALQAVMHRKPYGVDMTFETNVPDGFELNTDGLRVQQVLTNFLTNAIKHTKEGEICLNCAFSRKDNAIVFSVRDTGEGVPAEKAEQIFGRFEKLDSSFQATGLGLSICRLIAQHLNGEVSLDTTYTQGARFVFRHPIEV